MKQIIELLIWAIIFVSLSTKVAAVILTAVIVLNIYAILRMMTTLEPTYNILSIVLTLISPFHFIGYMIIGDDPERMKEIRQELEDKKNKKPSKKGK